MTRQRKEEIKKRIATRNVPVINARMKPVAHEESKFEKKKHADAIDFLKKNGLPESYKGKIDWNSL
jgi:hypothetical protein